MHHQNTQTDSPREMQSRQCEFAKNERNKTTPADSRKASSTNRAPEDPTIDVSVQVHEKTVIEKGRLEVASVAYMVRFFN